MEILVLWLVACMYKQNIKNLENVGEFRRSIYKDCLSLPFLAVVMEVFVVAMFKLNLKFQSKKYTCALQKNLSRLAGLAHLCVFI